jgi:thiamine transporter
MLAEGKNMSEITSQTKIIAEAVVIIALTVILKDVLPPIYQLPQGGSVTAAGMVPLLWFSLRRGLRSGLEACTIYGLVHMALPGSFIVDPVQALLDYPIAFGALGLAGIFRKYPLIGVGVGIAGRFLAHFAAGVWFFAEYAPAGTHPVIYSAVYNGGYLIIELIISAIIIYIVAKRRLLEIYL